MHTYQVLEGLDQITSSLKDAETGQRGYLITGEDSYLAPYTAASTAIKAQIDTVASLTAGNQTQQARIAKLRPLVEARFAEMQGTIDLRGDQGFEAAQAVVLTNKGKAVMDRIRAVLTEMAEAESSLLSVRAASTTSAAGLSRNAVLGGVALAILLVIPLAWLLARSILRPLSALTESLAEMADGEGDLTRRVDETRKDEFGLLGSTFNRFVAKPPGRPRTSARRSATSR